MDSVVNKINLCILVLTGIILLAALNRLIQHMSNFLPLVVIRLFGAAHFQKKWQSFLIPLAAVWISDIFICLLRLLSVFYNILQRFLLAVRKLSSYYPCRYFHSKKISIKNLLFASLTSTSISFIVTNFGCWLGNFAYTLDLHGLLT